MSNLHFTQHAVERLAQRGIPATDVDLILAIGSEVDDGYFVRAKDCEALERELNALRDRVRQLKGKRLVISNGQQVTGYHADEREDRRLLRKARG
jgi:hypothetical protein